MNLNAQWGKTLVNQLLEHGIDYFCLAPGFRVAPLALAIAEERRAKTFVHFDERGIAFHALGYAKATKRAACVIVTSGTAVGNLLPAVMEAYHSHIPLILLTCDRPHELRDTMANQATDQLKIFGNFVHYFLDLPTPRNGLPQNFLATTIGQAVLKAKEGPVQVNCPYAEPFFDETPSSPLPVSLTNIISGEIEISEEEVQLWADRLQEVEKGVMILGANARSKSAFHLANKLQWPVFADIISSGREDAEEMSVPYYHHIVKSRPELKADLILHFGDAFVSKPLLQWVESPIIHVASHPKRCDPTHQVTTRILCSPERFCQKLEPRIFQKDNEWFRKWKELSQAIDTLLPSLLHSASHLSEPFLIKSLEAFGNHALFFGNSMPIRDADMFFFPKASCGPIYANRGLSGIDGNIATIAGIAQTQRVIGVIGDQTFLHDLNSLCQLTKTRYPVKLIVLNNGGGGIFSFVAIGKRKDLLDSYFAAAHNTTFEEAASLFNLSYARVNTKDELFHELNENEPMLLEVVTNRNDNLLLHNEIDEALKRCTSFSTVS